MKTINLLLCFIIITASLTAADAPAKKKAAPKKAPAAETAKPSAKVEAIAKTLTASQKTKLLALLNEGDDKELQTIPGVGETRAAAIKKARPFADVTNVVKVDGVGEATFAEMVAHAKAGLPQSEGKSDAAEKKKAPAKSKSTAKKKEAKSSK